MPDIALGTLVSDRLITNRSLCQASCDGNRSDGSNVQSRLQAGAPFRGQCPEMHLEGFFVIRWRG